MSKGRWIFVSLAVVIEGLWLSPPASFYRLTGRFFPIHIVQELDEPAKVEGWSAAGLRLADGRTVQLPGFSALPEDSEALRRATEHGVEVGADGRVTGLVDVRHWCGNDPVREHIARVDLAYLLMYTHEGEYADPPAELGGYRSSPIAHRRRFAESGWDPGEHHMFQQYVEQAE